VAFEKLGLKEEQAEMNIPPEEAKQTEEVFQKVQVLLQHPDRRSLIDQKFLELRQHARYFFDQGREDFVVRNLFTVFEPQSVEIIQEEATRRRCGD
jgi:hypothetical protein